MKKSLMFLIFLGALPSFGEESVPSEEEIKAKVCTFYITEFDLVESDNDFELAMDECLNDTKIDIQDGDQYGVTGSLEGGIVDPKFWFTYNYNSGVSDFGY